MSDEQSSNISEATDPNKKQRFSVYVPNPSASLQLGAADYSNGFGYNGGALSVDPFLFIDVNKHMLYQSGTHSCFQVGGKWLQYANGPMYMTSLEHTTVGAGLKMLLVAGAAQGQITAVVHRKDGIPRIVEYNNITTRYRVEEQANNIVRFSTAKLTHPSQGGTAGTTVTGLRDERRHGRRLQEDEHELSLSYDPLDKILPVVEDHPENLEGLSYFRTYYPYAKEAQEPSPEPALQGVSEQAHFASAT
ncbi:MAG: hypothetical protein R3F14_13965 [Polyangiaceae bacterium]